MSFPWVWAEMIRGLSSGLTELQPLWGHFLKLQSPNFYAKNLNGFLGSIDPEEPIEVLGR